MVRVRFSWRNLAEFWRSEFILHLIVSTWLSKHLCTKHLLFPLHVNCLPPLWSPTPNILFCLYLKMVFKVRDLTILVSDSGEGSGSPLQCSCLENPMDGGAWWAAVHGVAQSQTWLKWLSSSSEWLSLPGSLPCIQVIILSLFFPVNLSHVCLTIRPARRT